jgi:hypothetical protein
MRPLARHASEDSLVQLLVLGAGSLSVMVTAGESPVAV